MGMFECSAVGCSDEVPGEGNELTVVVEYETDLEGGAYEVGVAPEGSPGLERLVSEACGEADALVGDEGGPCTLPERGEAHAENAGMPSACPRQLFRGCLAPSPNPCAPRGGAPWNLG